MILISCVDGNIDINNNDSSASSNDNGDDSISINSNSSDDTSEEDVNDNGKKNAINNLRWFCNNLENLLKQTDYALNSSVQRFVKKREYRFKLLPLYNVKVSINRGLKKVCQGRPVKNSKVNNKMQLKLLDYAIMKKTYKKTSTSSIEL
ncbi:hypothetical protein C2G38_2196976 [Gigaspora rosea]|uniref:Uncharacterized protein n=1 Tax=Gigaspora rosea TaxID=44941 RepID=A0A397V1F9_9GLOM|nr:hypothetical protein C2G38_2196976 [Gigaspora rosea]